MGKSDRPLGKELAVQAAPPKSPMANLKLISSRRRRIDILERVSLVAGEGFSAAGKLALSSRGFGAFELSCAGEIP
jgi:hypothetical protein